MPWRRAAGSGGGGQVTAEVHIPAVGLFEHPEDATTLFAAGTGAEGLTVTMREPLEYGQDTSDWSIVGAQRYQGVAAQDLAITGASFAHADYLGEHTTANAPARTTLTALSIFYDTTLGLFQAGSRNIDWRNVTVADWNAVFGTANLPWNPSGGWANGLTTANFYEYADQDAVEASLAANYDDWTSAPYSSSQGVLWFDQSAGDLKTFGAVTPAVEGVDPDPVYVVVDRDNTRITAYYNLAAGGALTDADTLGDLKSAFDTAAEGLSSEYVGGGDATTDMTRPFATVSQFSQADLRGLQLLLEDPVAAGARGNAFGLVARPRFPGGAETPARQAHVLVYTRSDRRGGVRINLDAGINGLNEHGAPVDVSTGELGNEWTFTAVDGTLSEQNVVTVSPARREIVYYALSTVDAVGANTLRNAVNQAGNGVSATTFGQYNGNAHPFTGSVGDVNRRPIRFNGGRDYHAATTNPEPIRVTVGPTHAHTRLYTVADGGILLSLTNPAHDGGNGFSFEASAGALAASLIPTEERIALSIPAAGSLASAILAALNNVEGLSAEYFGTEDGTNNVLPTRFGRHEMLGGLDATEIEIQYAPVASGGITTPDTMGDVKTAWDAVDGLLSFYYNGADAATTASRLVPWEHEFENGETDTINLSGFALGPEQNEFTGADRAAAEAARDAYAVANPTWVEAYRGQPNVWIALRWGTDQVGQVLRTGASNPPGAGDWIDQDLALRGSKGAKGDQGDDADVKDYARVGGRLIEPGDAEAEFLRESEVKDYARTGGRLIEPADADAAFMLDNEFNGAAVRALIGLTQAEQDAILLADNARVTNNVLILEREDGTEIMLTLPQQMAGTADGVITGLTFAADLSSLTITRSEGAAITVNIPAGLRASPRTDAQINTLIQNALAAAVQGNTETRITVTRQGDGTIDFVVDEFPTQAEFDALAARVATLEGGGTMDQTIRAAVSTDTTLDQAEYNAGTSSDTQEITIPTWDQGTRYVFIGVPEAENDITDIDQNGISEFSDWERVAGVFESHKWWRTTDTRNVFGSGRTYNITQ